MQKTILHTITSSSVKKQLEETRIFQKLAPLKNPQSRKAYAKAKTFTKCSGSLKN